METCGACLEIEQTMIAAAQLLPDDNEITDDYKAFEVSYCPVCGTYIQSLADIETAYEKVSDEFKEFLEERIEDMADGHIEAWSKEYEDKTADEKRTHLWTNHDISLEVEDLQDRLQRDLTFEEHNCLKTVFNETVLLKLK